MWHKLEFSSETIDNLKAEMQRLQDEGKRLLSEAKILEQEDMEHRLNNFSFVFQRAPNGEESGDGLVSRICRNLHY